MDWYSRKSLRISVPLRHSSVWMGVMAWRRKLFSKSKQKASIVHHGSNMIIFTNVNANIKASQKKDFRLGDHSSNKRHYLVLNTERSHKATNIQLIRGKLIRERDQSFKYEQNRSRRKRSSSQSNKTIISYQTGDVKK